MLEGDRDGGAYQTPEPGVIPPLAEAGEIPRAPDGDPDPLWPEVMIGMAMTLDRISELLGQDHDLAELLQALADRPDLCPTRSNGRS